MDGMNLNGFNSTKPAGTNNLGEQYAADPKPAFPAKDMSSQGEAGTKKA